MGTVTYEWTRVYEPVIPKAIFREHGHESIPDPEAFRITIVPNDDRDLEGDPDLLMFDYATESAVPIDAWIGGSTDGVAVNMSANPGPEFESESEPETQMEPESDPEPAPEPSEPKPDPELVSEEASSKSDGTESDENEPDSSNPFSSL